MTAQDPMREPWWASGSDPDDGLDDAQDPFDAHHGARHGGDDHAGAGPSRPGDDGDDGEGTATGETGQLAVDAIDLVSRFAAEVGRRIHARSTANASSPSPGAFTRDDPPADGDASAPRTGGNAWHRLAEGVAPHAEGEVCDACPVCLGLRALRQARPDVITHLSDAAHHVSLALRALADAQAGDDTDGLEKIDLDQ